MPEKKTIPMFAPFVNAASISSVERLLNQRWIGQGAVVDEFEKAVEHILGIRIAVAVNCSSSALRLALDICGVGPGDEVVTTPMTCSMTNHPILEQFAKPVFADIQPDTGNIDPADLEKRITTRTKAILCSHWGGYPCDLDELNRIAENYRLPVIEDASEAFGSTYRGRPVGSISRFTAFSFQAVQIITSGEGGMLIAIAPEDAAKARRKRWFGIDRDGRQPNDLGYYDFDITEKGYGYHLTNIAASIGMSNLASFSDQHAHRRRIASRYRQEFSGRTGIRLLRCDDDRSSANHYFTMHVERREEFCRMMARSGIQVSIVHSRNDLYGIFGGKRHDLPNLDDFCKTYIGLPLHMALSDEDLDFIIRKVLKGW